jgi:hypothetical protein
MEMRNGVEVKKKKLKQFNVMLPVEQINQIKEQAEKEERNVKVFVKKLIESALYNRNGV